MQSRTTIEVSETHRIFLDKLAHGQIKSLISGLLDCAVDLGKRYGDRQAAAFIQAGIMQLTDKPKGG